MNHFKILLYVLIPAIALFSCDRGAHTVTHEAESREVMSFSQGKKNLIVENQSGSIDITGVGDSEEFSVRIIRRASGTDSGDAIVRIEDVRISKETEGEDIIFKTDYPVSSDGYSVSYFITVPKYINLKLRQENGDINIKNTADNSLDIENRSGEITIQNVWSRNLEIVNGNGGITADFWPAEGSNAQLETGNGNIKISIPANSNTTIDASTENGSITHEGLPWVEAEPSGGQFSGVLGTGKSIIIAKVGNGNIFLRSNGNQFEVSQTSRR